MSAADMVREFHATFGLDMAETPALVAAGLAWQRQRLLVSETGEVADAVTDNDLAGIAQELADVVYVAYGTALAYGIDLDAVLAAVHAANMTKLGADGKPIVVGGKVLKGPNYRPPNVAGVLTRSLRRPPLRTPTPGRTDAHFSPGCEGEIPDHQGVFGACPMPGCATSRRQHEAADRIQDLTYELLGDDARGGAR